MSSFAIKYPFFILMACLMVVVVGTAALIGMPVDLFPQVNIPVVVVATFYSGMPPQQIESDITNSYERSSHSAATSIISSRGRCPA